MEGRANNSNIAISSREGSAGRVLINAANLHSGGGVQVATSLIVELSMLWRTAPEVDWCVYASSVVDANLKSRGFDPKDVPNYRVLDLHGLGALAYRNRALFKGFDLVLTVFGPVYIVMRFRRHIVGFAQGWIIHPENEVYKSLPLVQRVLWRVKFALQWAFFSRADLLVVELDDVKTRLHRVKQFPLDRIEVVPNGVSAVYSDESLWAPIPQLNSTGGDLVVIGYITRDYPHKNLDFLLQVGRELARTSSKRYLFFVTLNDEEWAKRSPAFREFVRNVGPLSVAQCPTFYKAMNGVIFPSLLECSSACPLEALAMRRPLFASDRRFVRDSCGDSAMYFDPGDSCEAAARIVTWFEQTTKKERAAHVDRAYAHLMAMPSSRERAKSYLEIIRRQLGESR